MLKSLLFTLWFFIPAGVANAVPVFAARLPLLKKWQTPIDFERTWQGKPILGKNKTWRGLATGIVTAIFVLWLQQLAVAHFAWASDLTGQIDYSTLPTVLLGALFGFGALAGDAIESFFKRRIGVPAGHSWFPFDQIDYVIGGAIAAAPIVVLGFWQYVWLIVVWVLIHLAVSYAGYRFGFKERPI